MACVWFSMLVLISVGSVTAKTSRNCSEEVIDGLRNCDECLKCGATWCMDPKSFPRCRMYLDEDSWCSNVLRPYGSDLEPHRPSDPQHFQKFVKTRATKLIDLKKPLTNPQITFESSSIEGVTTLDKDIIAINTESEDTTKVSVTPAVGFCPAQGRTAEQLTVKIQDSTWGPAEAVTITFEVPCACECSSKVDVKSKQCNGRGNYSCNICKCETGWQGDKCEANLDDYRRGDMGNCLNQFTNDICSNNGKCNSQDKCECDWSIEGSQYFDEQCTDICLITSFSDICLLETEPGHCKDNRYIYMDSLNRSRLAEIQQGQKMWVNCTEKRDECTIKYAAMRDSTGMTHVMILEPCNSISPVAAAATLKVTVPAILGVLAIVAAAASVAGYMVWKNRTPPLPLNDPGYTNIDAEDCTGMNPLYKPPTSSFKNPTYGKW